MARSNGELPEDLEVVVSIESWTCDDADGNAIMIHRSSRWRADDPIVRRRPNLFVPDGSTNSEVLRAREGAGIAGY